MGVGLLLCWKSGFYFGGLWANTDTVLRIPGDAVPLSANREDRSGRSVPRESLLSTQVNRSASRFGNEMSAQAGQHRMQA